MGCLRSVVSIAVVMGALLYLIEGEDNGFTSIPRGVYWAIVTMTTVGYGDISPVTVPGQLVAAVLMIAGYAIIASLTGGGDVPRSAETGAASGAAE